MACSVTNKVICLFADGTGNAFSSQESNVWRLYDALDKTHVSQISHYIPGVGTSGFKLWAILDGATGLGVPSNVRRLYEFLCWNYRPGDKIYLFGFSRGAFTIRVLIGMIDSEGLLSRQGKNGIVTRREMRRNIMAAWRSYRGSRKKSFRKEAPTVKITRHIRDGVLTLKRLLFRQDSYSNIKSLSDSGVQIEFAGLFDTVEAYGVPVEEMRDAINWAIWPIKFHDHKLSQKVVSARHALSLDDERQTFHPVRFDVTDEIPNSARIKEVWFAGVHSDVGGGYPDGALSLIPLDWMLEEIGTGLFFQKGWRTGVQDKMSALARTHDSRNGLGVFYRYAPRIIRIGIEVGGAPTLHHSVIEKIAFGDERYAPHSLPATVQILMPDGSILLTEGFQPEADDGSDRQTVNRAELKDVSSQEVARKAIEMIGKPDPAFVDYVNDGVWLRRKAYFAFLASCLFVASLPLTSEPIAQWTGVSDRSEIDDAGRVARVNGAFFASMQELFAALGGIVPSYLKPWVDALVQQPLVSGAAVLLAFLLFYINGRLRDRIADDARCAWFLPPEKQSNHGKIALWCARQLRQHHRPQREGQLLYWPIFMLTLVAAVVGSFLFLNRVKLSFMTGFGEMCHWDKKQIPRTPVLGVPEIAEGFKTSDPCWDTGFYVRKGFTYALSVEMVEPFLDGPKVVDIAGYRDSSWRHLFATPLKRWWSEAYFQPIARIGQTGKVEWPLRSTEGFEPLELGPQANVKTGLSSGVCEPAQFLSEAIEKQRQLNIRTRMNTRFTAEESGELFYYLNDAWLALSPRQDCFYTNNSGSAKVTITLLPEK